MTIEGNSKRGNIAPSLRGQFYSYKRGDKVVVCPWPPKRPKKPSAAQKAAQDAFLEVIRAMKLTAMEIQLYHRWNAEGTPMLPRDSLMAALYGRGPIIRFIDGRELRPMASVYDASAVLDALGWVPGDMLFRDVNYWKRLPIGEAGQALVVGQDGKPVWGEAGGGGGGGSGCLSIQTALSDDSTLVSSHGMYIEPLFPFRVSRVVASPVGAITGEFQATVWSQSGGTLSALLGQSDVVSGSFTRTNPPVLEVTMPENLPAGAGACVLITRFVDGVPATWACRRTTAEYANLPVTSLSYACRSNSPLAPGLRLTDVARYGFLLGLGWEV